MTPLEQLLVDAASAPDDPGLGAALAEAVMAATVLVPGYEEDGFRPLVLEGGVVPFYASAQAADATEIAGLARRPITGRELWGNAVRSGLGTVMHAYLPYGKHFTPAEMSDRLAGITPGTQTRTVQEQTELSVGTPAHVVPGLVEALTAHFDQLGGIDLARLAWVAYPDGLQGYLLVILTALPREQVVAGLDAAIGGLLGHRTLDAAVIAPGSNDLASSVAPFYPSPAPDVRRSRWSRRSRA